MSYYPQEFSGNQSSAEDRTANQGCTAGGHLHSLSLPLCEHAARPTDLDPHRGHRLLRRRQRARHPEPVLWPLAQRCGGGAVELGFLVSTFSVGRVLVSSEIGRFADESAHRHRGALLLSGAVLLAGLLLWANVLYAGGLPTLFVAQCLLGLGTGNLGVLRSYVAEQALPAERTWQLARLSALQYAGFAATPAVGAALFVAGEALGGDWKFCFPAYLLLLVAAAVQLLLWTPFKNLEDFLPLSDKDKGKEKGVLREDEERGETDDSAEANSDDNNEEAVEKERMSCTDQESENDDYEDVALQHDSSSITESLLPHSHPSEGPVHDRLALYKREAAHSTDHSSTEERDLQAVYALFVLLNFTTRGVVAMYESAGTALLLDTYGFSELQTGLLISLTGVVGTVNLLLFKHFWTQRFSNMALMLGGLALCLGAQLLIVNYGRDTPHPLWQYALSLSLVYAVGYPLGNSAVLGLFSLLSKQGRQGRAQGHFALMGSVARILMPVVAGYANHYLDPLASFALGGALMAASLFGVLFFYEQILFFQGERDPSIVVKRKHSRSLSSFQCYGMAISVLFFFFCLLAVPNFFLPKK